jgi:molybdopterin-guanine dinucleotide biosynthesis protein A
MTFMKWKYRHITGVILAGGECVPKDSPDKSLLMFDGKPFIQHIAETLQNVFEKVIIISDQPDEYRFLNLPVHADIIKDCDPLGAIHSALVNIETEEAFIVSADMPFIREEIIYYILKKENGADITIFNSEGKIQPFCGLYKSSCILPIAMNYLRGFISFQSFMNQMTIREITPDATMQPLVNHALATANSSNFALAG